jgi:hypothetical protein
MRGVWLRYAKDGARHEIHSMINLLVAELAMTGRRGLLLDRRWTNRSTRFERGSDTEDISLVSVLIGQRTRSVLKVSCADPPVDGRRVANGGRQNGRRAVERQRGPRGHRAGSRPEGLNRAVGVRESAVSWECHLGRELNDVLHFECRRTGRPRERECLAGVDSHVGTWLKGHRGWQGRRRSDRSRSVGGEEALFGARCGACSSSCRRSGCSCSRSRRGPCRSCCRTSRTGRPRRTGRHRRAGRDPRARTRRGSTTCCTAAARGLNDRNIERRKLVDQFNLVDIGNAERRRRSPRRNRR